MKFMTTLYSAVLILRISLCVRLLINHQATDPLILLSLRYECFLCCLFVCCWCSVAALLFACLFVVFDYLFLTTHISLDAYSTSRGTPTTATATATNTTTTSPRTTSYKRRTATSNASWTPNVQFPPSHGRPFPPV